jgi:hypothetical protein
VVVVSGSESERERGGKLYPTNQQDGGSGKVIAEMKDLVGIVKNGKR